MGDGRVCGRSVGRRQKPCVERHMSDLRGGGGGACSSKERTAMRGGLGRSLVHQSTEGEALLPNSSYYALEHRKERDRAAFESGCYSSFTEICSGQAVQVIPCSKSNTRTTYTAARGPRGGMRLRFPFHFLLLALLWVFEPQVTNPGAQTATDPPFQCARKRLTKGAFSGPGRLFSCGTTLS